MVVSSIPATIAMIAATTSNSTRLSPFRRLRKLKGKTEP